MCACEFGGTFRVGAILFSFLYLEVTGFLLDYRPTRSAPETRHQWARAQKEHWSYRGPAQNWRPEQVRWCSSRWYLECSTRCQYWFRQYCQWLLEDPEPD